MTQTYKIHRRTLLFTAFAGLAACTAAERDAVLGDVLGQTGRAGNLSESDAAAGIRAALSNGVASAMARVGRRNGFFTDPAIKIPLPGFLRDIQDTLSPLGLSGALDQLELQLNRGAEAAAPVARDIFLDAITQLSIRDAIGIVRGPADAATTYLKDVATPRLTALFRPIMVNALQNAGAIQTFDRLVADLQRIPLAPQLGANAKDDLIDHGVAKAIDGVFYYIAKEEAEIRSNPAKRTSQILRKVFG